MAEGFDLPVVTTDRLRLDALTVADLDVVHAEWGDPRVALMLATIKPNWSRNEARSWLERSLNPSPAGFGRAVRLLDGKLIGSTGAGGEPFNLGYFIAHRYWGQGYATEALRAFLPLVFDALPDLPYFEAEVFEDNPASSHILTKLGFQFVGPGACESVARLEPSPNWLYRLERANLKANT